MDSWEIELKLRKANTELGKMQREYESRQHVSYTNGTDLEYRTIKGTEEEYNAIVAKRKEVMDLQRQLEEAKRRERENNQTEVLNEERKIYNNEDELSKEEEHKMAFDRVKSIYKSQSIWQRVTYKIKGKTPNWRKVSNLSTEELVFLGDLAKGNTLWQQKVNEKKTERRQEKGMTIREIQEIKKEEAMNDFMKSINSNNTLKEKMDLDDTLLGGKSR